MANQDFNVLGMQRGKVGNVVGYVRKGKQCYRGYVSKVAQSKSETAMQAKAIFGYLGKIARAMRGAANRGFMKFVKSSTMSGSNIFMKENYAAVTASSPEEISVDYGAMIVSKGNLPEVAFKTPSFAEEAEVSVAFDSNNDMPGAADTDAVYIVVYQPDTMQCVVSAPSTRNAGSISTKVPARWSGMEVHVYGFVQNPEERYVEQLLGNMPQYEASPSVYIGHGNIA